jgi:hypothetical protein
MSRVLEFYRGELRHPTGVTIESIWGWHRGRLEHEHTCIQWLFPRSLRCMPGFYGFTMVPAADATEGVTITPASDFAAKSRSWLTPGNHNHLRITRILKSLCILGMQREAREWFAALQRVYVANADAIGSMTYEFWRKAVK